MAIRKEVRMGVVTITKLLNDGSLQWVQEALIGISVPLFGDQVSREQYLISTDDLIEALRQLNRTDAAHWFSCQRPVIGRVIQLPRECCERIS